MQGTAVFNQLRDELRAQRWDDHRFYHQSRINQSLHFISALSFLASYALLPSYPALAALLAWGVAMTTRQSGHFFFEPKGFDHANQVTHEYKEDVKVGYNLKRKVVLMGLWAASPLALWADPTLMGVFTTPANSMQWLENLGLVWLVLGVVGVFFRVFQLWVKDSLRVGLIWAFKIVTDPLYDAKLYYQAPWFLLRGQLIDPTIGRHSAT
ncbi:MAG: hypothetical protein O3C03_01490 [Proteobacteria bacterium]|nr:hypothetical protein [Pseudomonadota bacterium]MDA1327591.1 hypothetical protein [Pseudomonadota bacterium]NBR80558.1 hypothetical protein [Candidatus Fonsibacter lacus]